MFRGTDPNRIIHQPISRKLIGDRGPVMRMRRTIAVLFDYLEGDYQSALRRAIEQRAVERDINLVVVVGRPLDAPNPIDRAQNEIYRRLSAAAIDGFIFAAASLSAHCGLDRFVDFTRLFHDRPCCCVSMAVPGIPSIIVDNRRGSRSLVDHLIDEHGCRHVAYIRGPTQSGEANERYEAYRESQEAHGLAAEPLLIETGDFWIDQGAASMRRILDRGLPVDAVVAANDHMAFGALGAIRAKGIRVPDEIVLAGFDDAPTSLFASPSLTTARQPFHQLGEYAVEAVVQQLAGLAVPMVRRLDVELVLRQSCGCMYQSSSTSRASESKGPSRAPAPNPHEEDLLIAVRRCMTGPAQENVDGASRLASALAQELGGEKGSFLLELENLLDGVRSESVHDFYNVIALLRLHVRARAQGPSPEDLENLWHASMLVIGNATARRQARERFRVERAHEALRRTVERLSTALDDISLSEVLAELLPGLELQRAAISLYDGAGLETLRPLFLFEGSRRPLAGSELITSTFASSMLAPRTFFRPESRQSDLVLPLTFGTEQLGIAAFETGHHIAIYAMLREQIGAALKAGQLHRAVVHEIAARQRAERDELEKELVIARQIQTGILPIATRVEGLDLAGFMLPAIEVGGDYYDIHPNASGCWLAIGDVAGHGLMAGMVMLMIQSMISAMARSSLPHTPKTMFEAVNAALWDNVRIRLKRDEHATLMLLQYHRDGRLVVAGFHEEIFIWRARREEWEIADTTGVWAGAIKDASGRVIDKELVLEDGDLLVLYTDGITEASNIQNIQFGPERLRGVVEKTKDMPVEHICKAIVNAVTDWAPVQRDDMSVLIGRYAR